MSKFDTIWTHLQAQLKPDMVSPNWTAYRGNLGDTMKIIAVRSNCIVVDSPNAKSFQSIPKPDTMW